MRVWSDGTEKRNRTQAIKDELDIVGDQNLAEVPPRVTSASNSRIMGRIFGFGEARAIDAKVPALPTKFRS
jgi:hypothetical protein